MELITVILFAAASPLPNCQKQGWAIFIPGDQTMLPQATACQRDFPDNPGTMIGGYQLNFQDGKEAKELFPSVKERHPDARIIFDSSKREG